MGSLQGLKEWCRTQCEGYNDVDIKDMSSSFRDGLAFCAIIHRHRPDLIEFDPLSKENVYENNELAFNVAETELGIPALLDPEDMVSMKVPDRLSIITYISQYYNFFNSKSQGHPSSMKTPGCTGQKRPLTPLKAKDFQTETGEAGSKGNTLSSTCTACQKHVHLVQRFLVDGKLYHRNCFRCNECHSTLLPGSYKLENISGALVCTHHHIARSALANQNGQPDLSRKPTVGHSARVELSPSSHTSSSESDPAQNTSDAVELTEHVNDSGTTTEETPRSSSPCNPFDESDEDEDTGEEEDTPASDKQTTSVDDQPTPPIASPEVSRPVPAPRRITETPPAPRPAPRVRLHQSRDGLVTGESLKPPIPPKPGERSQSPGSLGPGLQKPKDPPWLSLVQSEPKKKKAPAPPGPPAPSVKEDPPRPVTPPSPSNPFGDDDDDDDDEAAEDQGVDWAATQDPAVASHPWYRITCATETSGADSAPTSGGSSSCYTSPARTRRKKKRLAPRVPQLPTSNQGVSIDSLSLGSDHSSLHPPLNDLEQTFTKSVSEPSICSPSDSAPLPSSSSSNEHLPPSEPGPYRSPTQSNASSAPATPQTSRSSEGSGKGDGPSPPQFRMTPSPLASKSAPSHNKQICKENPFNRKASPSPAKSKGKTPKGGHASRPPAPGHGFPLIKRKVQSVEFIPVEDIHREMSQLEQQLDELEKMGVKLEKKLRDNPNDEDEELLLVDWFTLIHEKHLLVRQEAELVYTVKQQKLEERQADVEYELRCLLNKPEKDWTDEDKTLEQDLMTELVTIIEQRNQIINSMDQDRQRDEEEDKLMEAVLKKKDFHKDPENTEQHKKKGGKFKHMKVLKRLSRRGDSQQSLKSTPSPSLKSTPSPSLKSTPSPSLKSTPSPSPHREKS